MSVFILIQGMFASAVLTLAIATLMGFKPHLYFNRKSNKPKEGKPSV